MQIRFLLGPAGSGKTFRCLEEVRSELAARPEGDPLIFLAPKQATFQLERQLLGGGDLPGYARLRILSFQRLARWIFLSGGVPEPRLLSSEGRVMVLRALLNEIHGRLTLFRRSARRLGFAEEASAQLREFQQLGLTPEDVRKLAADTLPSSVQGKLSDLALLFEAFQGWLQAHNLHDEEWLLSGAARLLEENPGRIRVHAVWFDGFAQLTPQERYLLSALVQRSESATLAFCLDRPLGNAFSPWFMVNHTYARCRAEFEVRFGADAVQTLGLERGGPSRFARPALAHLESAWASGAPFPEPPIDSLRLVEAPDPAAEIAACARDILRYVRSGGRYRDTAVLLRGFDNDYPHLLHRIFERYQLPFFLDHRASVSHHPLAELTRGALRLVLFQWKHHDCFAVFKSGFFPVPPGQLDELENEALAHGWEGAAWHEGFPLPKNPKREAELNAWREDLVAPLLRFSVQLSLRPSGAELVAALRDLWASLRVEEQLQTWALGRPDAIHETVWEQMSLWLENLQLAFAPQRLPLREWLPVVEAGLDSLTVGVIPPVLDQVLVGTVDRSRNPDLKRMWVLGLNEGSFPAIPPHKPLLTERDRQSLLALGCELADAPSLQISREQFYGYIACTRARESLVLSYARTDPEGGALNPSRFIGQIRRLFPGLALEYAQPPASPAELEHLCELQTLPDRSALPRSLRQRVRILPAPDPAEKLDPAVARRLYGPELHVSVSALERFASCPYRFFLERGLHVRERVEFRLDIREQGSFQHEVLARFHQEIRAEGRQWRDLTAQEGRDRIGRLADETMESFHEGLLRRNEQNKFTAANYKAALQDFIAAILDWFDSNDFNPAEVELPFGQDDPGSLPPWRLPLPNGGTLVLGGRIDRVDIRRIEGTDRAACLVFDYKSGLVQRDPVLLRHGIQQQLPAYLRALLRIPGVPERLGVRELVPSGCFYVPLKARFENRPTRALVLEAMDKSRRAAYAHRGLFDFSELAHLDRICGNGNGGSFQFVYRLTKQGTPRKDSFSAQDPADFLKILAQLEENTRDFGDAIYRGEIGIRPYKKGPRTACEQCRQISVCRFDPWTQDYNVLRKPPKKSKEPD